MSEPQTGAPAPDFSAASTAAGGVSRLADLRGAWVVLYFYPRDNTPGCTREGQDFRDLHPDFVARNIVVLGVSRDSLKSHEAFRAAQNLPFDLLSDADETLCRAYDVLRPKTQYGRTSIGLERSTFLIDADGILRQAWRKVRVDGHAAKVLATATALLDAKP